MTSYHGQVGYNYVATLQELLKKFTYKEIAERVGYKSVGSLTAVLCGTTPSHVHGEAIWALYSDTFHRKPPLLCEELKTDCAEQEAQVKA